MKKGIGISICLIFLGIAFPNLARAETFFFYGPLSSNATWSAPNTYVIDHTFKVLAGVTLTIESGAIVKFRSGSSLQTRGGNIEVKGTKDKPVYFTSIKDDSVGGDTNGDGFNSSPNMHDSWGIDIFQSPHSLLSFLNMRYADRGIFMWQTNVSVDNLNMEYVGQGIAMAGAGELVIDNSTFKNIYMDAIAAYEGSSITVSDTHIENVVNWEAIGLFDNSHISIKNSSVTGTDFAFALGLYGSSAEVYDSSFSDGLNYGVALYNWLGKSNLTMTNSTIKDYLDAGIGIFNSEAHIDQSVINDNIYGIWARSVYPVTISRSSLYDNFIYAIKSESIIPTEAIDNWWGDDSGPFDPVKNPDGFGDEISGNINFEPWLIQPPTSYNECCSSVVFLPGIKGSVLQKVNVTGDNDTLWPPAAFSNDVPQLALNESGQSLYPIKVAGILNTFYSTPIYSGFSSFMDGLQAIDPQTGTSTIKGWLPLGYDWRYSPEKIIADGIDTVEGKLDVIDEIEELAQNSYTGKVTIVAHSMGGLLGKEIIKELQNRGKASLIDSFVMVGSPQLGTPQAIASLLHGDGEGIAAGIIVDASDTRAIAQNMQSAYNLLPSEKYFAAISEPVAIFGQAGFTENWRNLWGDSLNSYLEWQAFGTGADGRSEPDPDQLLKPEIIRSDLLQNSRNFHATFDSFQFPDSIRVVQIAGWGMPTLKSIEYKNYHFRDSYKGVFTTEGDGTVIYPSAISSNANDTYYFDLSAYNDLENIPNFQHRNLLSAPPIQNTIDSIIKRNNVPETDFILFTKPDPINEGDRLIVSTHSPVILGAYDNQGNFTGIDPNQGSLSGLLRVEEEIPGSTFVSLGDSQYVFLPKSGSYNFIFEGTGEGQATVEIENFANDTAEPVASFIDIDVNQNTSASFSIESSSPQNAYIEVDENGDGRVDSTVFSDNSSISLAELFKILKKRAQNLDAKNGLRVSLLNRIDNLEKKIEEAKGKDEKMADKIQDKVNKEMLKGKIESSGANDIINILNQIESLL